MRDGFIGAACGVPNLRLADCHHNAEQTFTMMRAAEKAGAALLILPELGLTGAACGDLFWQDTLLRGAEEALATVLEATRNLDVLTAAGLPVRMGGVLCDCAAVMQRGKLLGIVPKTALPPAQRRWFSPGPEGVGTVSFAGCASVPFGTGLLFRCTEIPDLALGIEIGEDLSAPVPSSVGLAQAGASIIGHLSAVPETAGSDVWRRQLALVQSGRLTCGYVCAGAGEGESVADGVCGAHQMIIENGVLLAEKRFEGGLLASEIDVQRLAFARRRDGFLDQIGTNCGCHCCVGTAGGFAGTAGGFAVHGAADVGGNSRTAGGCVTCAADGCGPQAVEIPFSLTVRTTKLRRYIAPLPFVPEGEKDQRCREVLMIASTALKRRLETTNSRAAVIGLSGGLDSTLAVLITGLALKLLDRPMSDIIAVTMPCFGTTDRTRNNAALLAERMGATLRTVDISAAVRGHLRDIGHDMENHNTAYENAQARERTQVLMDIANDCGGLVIGTGDLSELALGWCTYNGDHMSMYAVNAGIPKTLVRDLVAYLAREDGDGELREVLQDILDTPVSPELLPALQGEIAQRTEDLVGPYELHDFFLYYLLRWGCGPKKLYRLAVHAFANQYSREVIAKWLKVFCRRFFSQQFKRDCVPDGPAVGSVGLSPRGAWVMPSDAAAALWLAEAEEL